MDIFKTVLYFLVGLVGKKSKEVVEISIPLDPQSNSGEKKEENMSDLNSLPITSIDWTNPQYAISKHFTVKEACYLPSWDVMHIPSEDEKQNIVKHAAKMDLIRDYLGVPLSVHCWMRPILNNPESEHNGQDYNALVKGAKNSAHKVGLATDYNAEGLNCDEVRAKLESKLEEWDLRMEKNPGSDWVHNDSAPVISTRYFIP